MLDGYIRVSEVGDRKGERFISPTVQRDQITSWADLNGVRLGKTLVELDESGARADRPLLMSAIERIEAGLSEGIVVAKVDRFGRSLLDGLSAIARIERAGGTFVSVQDGFDLATPTGKLMLRMMLTWAEWELDRIRQNREIATEKAVARGVYVGWKGPPGYVRGADGRLRVEPVAGRIMAEVFRRRASGASAREIANFLNQSSLETHTGVPFRSQSVYRMIASRAYLGESRHGRHANPKAHEPIVDASLWEEAQFERRPRLEPAGGLLARIARCASCGRSLVTYPAETKRSPGPTYRCYRSRGRGTATCPRPAAVPAAELEPLVEDYVISHASADQVAEYSLPTDPEQGWAQLTRTEHRRLIAEVLDCIVVERGREPIAERAWLCTRGKGSRSRGWNEPVRVIDLSEVDAIRLPSPALWPEMRIKAELASFLEGRSAWPTYDEFARAGRARLHSQMMSCGGPYWWGPRLDIEVPARSVVWNETRIRGALRPYLRGCEQFPSRKEFEDAGLRSLRTAIDKHGGLAYWADEFGLESRARTGRWTSAIVRSELKALLVGLQEFPTREEFRAAGKLGLYNAARRHGGIPYWRRRFALRAATWRTHEQGRPDQ